MANKFPPIENLVIENIRPTIDAGRFAIKKEPMDWVEVNADVFRHGHDTYDVGIRFRKLGSKKWSKAPMILVENDHWSGRFQVKSVGFYEYAVEAWTISPKDTATVSDLFEIRVDPVYARNTAWYEMFPRSQGKRKTKSATWKECSDRLDDIKAMGFDTVYLVPIHPVGETNRKGANNSLKAKKSEPGCPYAIGNSFGGHYEVDPDIGTMEEFDQFMADAKSKGMRMALDIALNCSPDHPHVKEHPEWFFHEADGTIKCAENPPKKYEDIYPYDFYNENWKELWIEIRDMMLYWVEKGFTSLRIDNPHTKPFSMWEWLIREIKLVHPEVCFLAEAFTRPTMMARLGKIGFDLSYTYFTWRNEKWEIEEYLNELTNAPAEYYMRGMFFPTTPDIFPECLWGAGPESFRIRLFLAATLSSAYGMYNGYELCENEKMPGKEELNHSEKYQYKVHDWNSDVNIKDFITKVNQARIAYPAFGEYNNLTFHHCENDNIIAYSKRLADPKTRVICVINIDPANTQQGMVNLNMEALGMNDDSRFAVKDLLNGEFYMWQGSSNFVEISADRTAHIFSIQEY